MSDEIANHPAEKKRSRSAFLPIVLLLSVVVGPLLIYGLRPEISKWHIASASEQLMTEGYDTAIDSLSESIEREPEDKLLLAKRAEWLAATGKYEEALADSNKIFHDRKDLDLIWKIPRGFPSDVLTHVELLTRLGKSEEAIFWLQKFEKTVGEPLLNTKGEGKLEPMGQATLNGERNNIAFFYSRIYDDLDSEDQEKLGTMIDLACRNYLPENGNSSIIAQLYAMDDQHERAVEAYSELIGKVRKDYQQNRKQLSRNGTAAMSFGVPLTGKQPSNVRTSLLKVHTSGDLLHQLLVGRAHSHEKLDKQTLADDDRTAASKLGNFPSNQQDSTKSAESEPEEIRLNQQAIYSLGTSASYIDTRGCVRLKQGDLDGALKDFNYVVQALDALEIAGRLNVDRTTLRDPREATINKLKRKRERASILYHRLLTLRALKLDAEAYKDEQAIEELGIQVDSTLF